MSPVPARYRWALTLSILCCLLQGSPASAEQAAKSIPKSIGKNATASHYLQPAKGPVLSTHELDSILDELAPPQLSLSMWDRISTWLEEYFQDRTSATLPDLFQDFRLPDSTVQWIFYVTCAIILILAGAIVVNELRHIQAHRKPTGGPESSATAVDRHDPVPDQGPMAVFELPAYFLNMLIARLQLAQPGRTSRLTHREIVEAAGSLVPAQRTPVVEIANIAERIRYAGIRPAAREVEGAIAETRKLLDALEASS